MESHAIASIELSKGTLRYAEAAHQAGGVRPLRLGSCDFDFDVAHALLHAADPAQLDVVGQAVSDVFAGSEAERLHLVIHPPNAYAFVTVVPADLPEADRAARFQQEAALVAGTASGAPLHVTTSAIHAETHLDMEPVQVLAVPDDLHARFRTVAEAVPQAEAQWMLSTQAAARVVAAEATAAAAMSLVVGAYPTHTEVGVLQDGHWYYSHYVDSADPTDAVYNTVALLERLEIPRSIVAQVAVYGIDLDLEDVALFETVFDTPPRPLQPFGVLGLDRSTVQEADLGAGAYAPCIGAVL